MQAKKKSKKAMIQDPEIKLKKHVDYLQRQYPWRSREFITKVLTEESSDGRKILKILGSAGSGSFGRPHHSN
ncbi:MAG: hypothetical protein IT249_05930 [Chitinophagaceae bacterium]|nr:hypothetical protein [Chitinophagaceae bacterium]